MLAIGYKQASPELSPHAFQAVNMAKPAPAGHDLLVKVDAVSVNPVDTKIRKTAEPDAQGFKVLGWDAVGVVQATGSEVSHFKEGDRVFYAGDISRSGSNAEYQLVDERIVGPAPTSLSDAESAALPLTGLTAWELLFDRFGVVPDTNGKPGTLLVIAGAGGVGSMLIQLARQLTSLTVVATASRQVTREWATEMGAHHVLDHSQPLGPQYEEAGLAPADYVASLSHTQQHFESAVNILRPQGKFGLIDDPGALDISLLKRKSISLHWEFMYTRSLFNTDDITAQRDILTSISKLCDAGTLKTTLRQHLGKLNPQNLYEAHKLLESNRTVGKIVLEGIEG
ncbi:zinc-binding alcohol dehydrogenase family protein [Alteromonas sp. ASW11-19]|uniref:Zinc-type alcohol dehydrogenase-like protein n=1 Tax=Alteromonas salexigens TaxID=2982530 RepID=A0ABT2VQV3_9ALTE|nr:zinc-binding alcohol dehydrogenase family protein [Alteromonas salexigens]MCU7555693.1 zinc-binding alcohol dehydrogenase family protein [Alteromonas salexigens]